MRIKIFQPFQRVYTPRTPDSNYSSFGIYPPPIGIVMVGPKVDPQLTEPLPTGVFLQAGAYYAMSVATSGSDKMQTSVTFLHGNFTPPPY